MKKDIKKHFKTNFKTLPAKQKSIYQYLFWMCKQYEKVFCSQSRIASVVGCTREYVWKVLKKFREYGWIFYYKANLKTCFYMIADPLKSLDPSNPMTFRPPPKRPPKPQEFTAEFTAEFTQVLSNKNNNIYVPTPSAVFSPKSQNSMIESMPIRSEEKQLFYHYYEKDRKSFIQTIYDISDYRRGIRNYAALFTSRYKKHCKQAQIRR